MLLEHNLRSFNDFKFNTDNIFRGYDYKLQSTTNIIYLYNTYILQHKQKQKHNYLLINNNILI